MADPNLYAYVNGAVLQNVDPLGLCPTCGSGGNSGDGEGGSEGTKGDVPYGTGAAVEPEPVCIPDCVSSYEAKKAQRNPPKNWVEISEAERRFIKGTTPEMGPRIPGPFDDFNDHIVQNAPDVFQDVGQNAMRTPGAQLRKAKPAPRARPTTASVLAQQIENAKKSLQLGKKAARARLSRALGKGDGQAHHLIPLELKDEPIVKKAAEAGFDFNGKENGKRVLDRPNDGAIHMGSHKDYTAEVKKRLDALVKDKLDMTPSEAADALRNLNREIADKIDAHKGPINELKL